MFSPPLRLRRPGERSIICAVGLMQGRGCRRDVAVNIAEHLAATIDDSAKPMVVACHCICRQKRSGSPFGEMAYHPPIHSIYEQNRHRWVAMPEVTDGFVKGRAGEPSR